MHSSTDGHLGYFHVVAVVTNAAMNTEVFASHRNPVFISFGYTRSGGIVGLYDRSVFSFSRKLHAVFHSGLTSSHSHQQCVRLPFPHILGGSCCSLSS